MGKKVVPAVFPFCLVSTYPKGNYTVTGKYGECFNPTFNHSVRGDYQRIEVYVESCYNNAIGVPPYGCTSITPGAFFLIYGLSNDCQWQQLHVPNTSAIANYTITKNSDIPDSGCTSCTPDSCRVDCSNAPDGFCCIDHSFTDRLLQVLQN